MNNRVLTNSVLTRRSFLGVSAGVGLGVFLAACAPGGVAPQAPQAAGGSQAGAGTGGLAYQGELEYWDWDYEPRAALLEKYSNAWVAEHPAITLKRVSQAYADAQTKLLTAASSGNNPPFANIHNTWRPAIQRQGLLEPYPDDLLPFDKLLSTPYNRDPQTGKVYTCTFNYFCDELFFNTDLLAAEGIKPEQVPAKWEDYLAMAQQLTKRGADGKVTQAGMTLNHYYSRQWLWQTLVYQLGGWLYNEDGTEALWNSEEGVAALQTIKDIYFKYKLDDVDFLSLWDAFGTGKAASYISQGYTATWDTDYPDIAGKWSTQTTPTFTGSTPDHAWGMVSPEEGFGVFKNATPEQKEAAFSFIGYAVGPDEHALEWAKLQGGPPDRSDLLDSPDLLANDKYGVIANQGKTLPYRVNPGEQPLQAEKHWRTMFDRILLENAEAKAALDEATANFNTELKDSGDKPLITERAYKQP